MKYLIAIDQGTTGTTSFLVDAKTLGPIDSVNLEFTQIYPSPEMVEHNLEDIWNTVEKTIAELLEKNSVDKNNIIGIGITNQRETTCAFTRQGEPLHNAIVWQDRRTSDYCEKLKQEYQDNYFKEKTGLTINPYFSASKMNWLLSNSDQVNSALKKENLLFGTIDTFLIHKLTGGESYVTEPSNASRTLLMNLTTCCWDKELLNIFNIPMSTLPRIKDSFGEFGVTSRLSFLPDGIPITGVLGDQQSALFGQAGINKGDMKCTYGTGAFMLVNSGEQIINSKNGLLSTVAYMDSGKCVYALEGSSYIAGAAVQWLRDNLKIIETAPQVEDLANEVTDLNEMKNILFLPFFTGIGSPHWVADANAAILGITRGTDNSHLARACLEGIALSINDLINAIKIDTGMEINKLKVDGGAVQNNLLMEIQANLSQLIIQRPQIIETTAYGAALAAAVGLNLITISEIKDLWKKDAEFINSNDNSKYFESKQSLWQESIKKLFL